MAEKNRPKRGVSDMFGDEGRRFAALLKKDPARSLEKRWAWLRKNNPGRAASTFGFVPMIIEHGHAVISVPEDRVIFTIGLQYRFGHPELLISSPSLVDQQTELKGTLNELAARIADGEKIAPGRAVPIRDRKRMFHRMADEDFDRFPCGYLARFEEVFADRLHTRGGTLPILWTTERTGRSRR